MKKVIATLCLGALLFTTVLPGFASAADVPPVDNGEVTIAPAWYDGPHIPIIPVKK